MADWNTRHRAPARLAILDGCCGIGGISHGLAQAGHDVWGVDSNPALEEDYLKSGAAGFICADILDVLEDRKFMRRFDATVVSPPCQAESDMCNCRPGLSATYEQLIPTVRELLTENFRGPWTIENVSGSRALMRNPRTVCMWGDFGRATYRHRLVEGGGGLVLEAPPAVTGVIPPGSILSKRLGPNRECGWHHPVAAARAGHWTPGRFVSVSGHERRDPVREVMEIPWARNREDVVEAVPPYVGAWIGQQLSRHLERAA